MRTLLLFLAVSSSACMSPSSPPDALNRDSLATETERLLEQNLLDTWYPRAIDMEAGGYLTDFDADWRPDGPQQKMVVTQARHVWTLSRAAAFTGDRETYLAMAEHGVSYLRDTLWDGPYGGFLWLVSRDGSPVPEADGRVLKRAYGNAFAIYGLAAYAEVSGDGTALELARQTFGWLEEHAHDPVNGGYFNWLTRDGEAIRTGVQTKPEEPDFDPTPPKDQNSSIHLMEAFTELYRIWPDSLLRERLVEMLHLVRDTMVADPGLLRLYFLPDWTSVSYRDSTAAKREANEYFDHVSFGHDVETAYLMLEASEALNDRSERDRSLSVGKRMVDHALRSGWDTGTGGLYDAGYYLADRPGITIIRDTKNWWAQAEALNTLLLFGDLYPDDPARYHAHFLEQWTYVNRYVIDQDRGGWYDSGLDRQPEAAAHPKAQIWKANYHTARALMEVAHRLRTSPAD